MTGRREDRRSEGGEKRDTERPIRIKPEACGQMFVSNKLCCKTNSLSVRLIQGNEGRGCQIDASVARSNN